MVTIVPGTTLAEGEVVSAARLETLIEGSVLSNIVRSEFDEESVPITVDTSEPGTPETGDVWFDDTLKMVRRYVSSRWEPVGKGMALRNNKGYIIPKGALCRIEDGNDVEMTFNAYDGTCVGAALATIPSGEIGVIQSTGFVQVLCTPMATGFTAGELLTTSGTSTGVGISLTTQHAAATNSGATYRSDVGIVLGTVTTFGLTTCLLWR